MRSFVLTLLAALATLLAFSRPAVAAPPSTYAVPNVLQESGDADKDDDDDDDDDDEEGEEGGW
jgi:hypothetical protein